MKLEVGMYVRIKTGLIDKLIDIRYNDNYKKEPSLILLEKSKGYVEQIKHNIKESEGKIIIDDDTKTYWLGAFEVKEASFNIVDLIEEGDYVNRKQVIMIKEDKGYKEFFYSYCYANKISLPIKSIVTKEQFENMSYRIGE